MTRHDHKKRLLKIVTPLIAVVVAFAAGWGCTRTSPFQTFTSAAISVDCKKYYAGISNMNCLAEKKIGADKVLYGCATQANPDQFCQNKFGAMCNKVENHMAICDHNCQNDGCCVCDRRIQIQKNTDYCRFVTRPCVDNGGGDCQCPLQVPYAGRNGYSGQTCNSLANCRNGARVTTEQIEAMLKDNCMCPLAAVGTAGCGEKNCTYKQTIKTTNADPPANCCDPTRPGCNVPPSYGESECGANNCLEKAVIMCDPAAVGAVTQLCQVQDNAPAGPIEACVILNPPKAPKWKRLSAQAKPVQGERHYVTVASEIGFTCQLCDLSQPGCDNNPTACPPDSFACASCDPAYEVCATSGPCYDTTFDVCQRCEDDDTSPLCVEAEDNPCHPGASPDPILYP
jgi:hypothetical protein